MKGLLDRQEAMNPQFQAARHQFHQVPLPPPPPPIRGVMQIRLKNLIQLPPPQI
jgi:hypothetical protein